MKYQELGRGIVRRREKKALGLFIDGTGLDRATRRLNRKVNLEALVRGVSSGLTPVIARYYTLIPYEDDSRQRAFLDAVSRAGLTVVVKRLPPKGVNRQVSIDVEMAADILSFAFGYQNFAQIQDERVETFENTSRVAQAATAGAAFSGSRTPVSRSTIAPLINSSRNRGPVVSQESPSPSEVKIVDTNSGDNKLVERTQAAPNAAKTDGTEHRIITVVCPSRELHYPIQLLRSLSVETTAADFGQFSGNELMKSSSKWIDLSESETIWRD